MLERREQYQGNTQFPGRIDVPTGVPSVEGDMPDMFEDALRFVENESRHRMFVIAEGPPIYLWPALPSHDWRSPAFVNGWRMVNVLNDRIPSQKLRHYVLVDDMNFRPNDVVVSEFQRQTDRLWRSSPEIQDAPIFTKENPAVKKIF